MQCTAQVFIFTHSWEDFCELAYRPPKETSLFEITKQNGISTIHPCMISVSPYQKLFKEIYTFSQMDQSDSSFEETALHMPNTMRRVLEEYLSFNCGVSSVGAGNIQAIGEALFSEKKSWTKVSQNQRSNLSLLLSVTNLFSHKIAEKHDAATIQKCAKFMMNRIAASNHPHFVAMKQ